MQISIDEILDYKDCPQMYKFKHVDFLPEKRDLKDYFQDAIRQTISYYYFCMIDRKEKSLNNLFTKWEMLWFTPEIETNFPEEDVREFSNKAVGLLKNFHNYNQEERVTPIAVDFKYNTIFDGETNIHITGQIDLIKVIDDKSSNRKTELIFFSHSRVLPDEFLSKIDLKYTIASYAFRKSFKTRESNIVVCNIGKKKSTIMLREGSDFERAKKILYNIGTGINNRIFYPSDNPVTCSRCKYRVFCMSEKVMEDRNAIGEGFNNRT